MYFSCAKENLHNLWGYLWYIQYLVRGWFLFHVISREMTSKRRHHCQLINYNVIWVKTDLSFKQVRNVL